MEIPAAMKTIHVINAFKFNFITQKINSPFTRSLLMNASFNFVTIIIVIIIITDALFN
jgi:hypothetical protein